MSQKSKRCVISLRDKVLEFRASSSTNRSVWLLTKSCFNPLSAPASDWRARLEVRAELSASESMIRPPVTS